MTKIAVIMTIIVSILAIYETIQVRKLRNQTIEAFKRICEGIKEDDR